MPRILFVYTSANKTLTGKQTGWYLPEAAHPFYRLAPHADIDFGAKKALTVDERSDLFDPAAPAGPNPPVDEGSVKTFKDEESVKFLQDSTVISKFNTAKKLSDVNVDDYDGVFYVGGHGPVIDLPSDPVNIALINKFWAASKIVSAVCHGPAALVGATDSHGNSIFAGKRFTGFSNVEEEQVNGVQSIPFLLEDKIKALGGKYEKADPWAPKVVVDGKLITGQNPASAASIAEPIIKALKT